MIKLQNKEIQMAHVRVFTLLGLVFGFQATLLILPVQAETSCLITADQKTADCRGLRLEHVPVEELPDTLEVLDLSYNIMDVIRKVDFAGLPLLKILWLQYNNISVIEDDAFQNNLLLEVLNMFNNSLTSIPSKVLAPLRRLQNLELSNNLYNEATLDDVFWNFKNLKVLSLGGPDLSIFKEWGLDVLQNTSLEKFAIKFGTKLDFYHSGYLKKIQTTDFWLDVAIDNRTHVLPMILSDLANKSFNVLRFRNLFKFNYYTETEDIFYGLQNINPQQLFFHRGKFNEELLRMALSKLQTSSQMKSLGLFFIDFARSQTTVNNEQASTVTKLALDMLVLSDINNPDILQFDWSFTWLDEVHHLRINNVNFGSIICEAWEIMRLVQIVDVSKNQLKDQFLINSHCSYRDKMPLLNMFNISNNLLTSLSTIASLTEEFTNLEIIDISYNDLGSVNNGLCSWNQNITKVIASHNSMVPESFKCLPTSVVHLDLSYCNLDQLDMDYFMKAIRLREIYLTGNKIKFIPSDWKSPSLEFLAMDGNSFGFITTKAFNGMPNLKILRAGNNPYHCTCDLHRFIEKTIAKDKVQIIDWPESYKCYHPADLLNTVISHYLPSHLVCDVRITIAISVVITSSVVLTIMLMCYFFKVPWYAKATYQILRAKYRAHKESLTNTVDFVFHAFISYSHSDADWVRDQLLPCLENSRPPYRLCIHERDFMPGKWIIDNIIENIENSHKVIFVLSKHFVNSEWCNYELYFAQQRAMGKAFSDVILVVKEPIDPNSLPSKYCKLKKLLSMKTYLEWPEQPKYQTFFWAQLKSVLGKPSLPQEFSSNMSRRPTTVSTVSVIKLPQDNGKPADPWVNILDEETRV